MKKINFNWPLLFLFLLIFSQGNFAQEAIKYLDADQLNQAFSALEKEFPSRTKIHTIAESPGKKAIQVFEIKDHQQRPALFVAANLDGNSPVSSLSALMLAKRLLKEKQAFNWYILYNANPDALQGFFNSIKNEQSRNASPWNDDKDENIDEDDFDDLNKDGLISQMLVPDPTGIYLLDTKHPEILRQAQKLKGEKGMYVIYSEGIDNDKDGLLNEDPSGGVAINKNFPHEFEHFKNDAGAWPGSSPEAYGIMKFIYEHPQISMAISLGSKDLLSDIKVPKKQKINLQHIRISKRTAGWLGIDHKTTYSFEQIKTIVQKKNPDRRMTTYSLARMLDLGEVTEIFSKDASYFSVISGKYKKHISDLPKTISLPAIEKGGFEKWAYYHLGIPSFAINLWAVPLTKDSAISKENQEIHSIIQNKENLLHGGFIPWNDYEHPQFGKVKIGGIAPFAKYNPKNTSALQGIEKKLDFLIQLQKEMPDLHILKHEVKKLSNDIYQIDLWTSNDGFLPYPLFMGEWNAQPKPLILEISGEQIQVLNGKKRTILEAIPGKTTLKNSWIIQVKNKKNLSIHLKSEQGWEDVETIKL